MAIDPAGRLVSIIPADRAVVVDGEARFCTYPAAPDLHALQWTGAEGYAEYEDAAQARFTDPAILAPALEAWDLAGPS